MNLISFQDPLQPNLLFRQTNFTSDATSYNFQIQVGFENPAYLSNSLSPVFKVQYAPLIKETTDSTE
jgi:hypothetical protein